MACLRCQSHKAKVYGHWPLPLPCRQGILTGRAAGAQMESYTAIFIDGGSVDLGAAVPHESVAEPDRRRFFWRARTC